MRDDMNRNGDDAQIDGQDFLRETEKMGDASDSGHPAESASTGQLPIMGLPLNAIRVKPPCPGFVPDQEDMERLARSYLEEAVQFHSFAFFKGECPGVNAGPKYDRFERVARHLGEETRQKIINGMDSYWAQTKGDKWEAFKYTCDPGFWSTPADLDAIARVAESTPDEMSLPETLMCGSEFLALIRAVKRAVEDGTNWKEDLDWKPAKEIWDGPQEEETPCTPPTYDEVLSWTNRKVREYAVYEPVYEDEKPTGQFRVCRRPKDRRDLRWLWATGTPWEPLLLNEEELEKWLEAISNGEAPFMAEAFDVLLERIRVSDSIPMEIELELEDDNSISWDTINLVEAAKASAFPLSGSDCESLGLQEGSCYADAALVIEARMKED